MRYSVIIPVYNRPDEIKELLESLNRQTYTDFEILIIEDGSEKSCKDVIEPFKRQLNIRYYYKKNSGQGFSRNFGFKLAKGDYFVVFDSDCILPEHYFEAVNNALKTTGADCWGGPDKAHNSFTNIQKAVNFSMTSFLTTGGIRGKKKHLGNYHPRSFNMGISKEVFEKTGGYRITRLGEDIEFSIRINELGFTSILIEGAFVYHKRRTTLSAFYKQLHFFGRARINIGRFYKNQIQLVHWFPVLFTVGLYFSLIFFVLSIPYLKHLIFIYLGYSVLLFLSSLQSEKKFSIAGLSVVAGFIQLTAYAHGFIKEFIRYHFLNQKEPKQE